MADPAVEVSESGTICLKVSVRVHYTSTDALKALKHKEIMTNARREAALRKTSIVHFSEGAINNDRTKSKDAEVKHFFGAQTSL